MEMLTKLFSNDVFTMCKEPRGNLQVPLEGEAPPVGAGRRALPVWAAARAEKATRMTAEYFILMVVCWSDGFENLRCGAGKAENVRV